MGFEPTLATRLKLEGLIPLQPKESLFFYSNELSLVIYITIFIVLLNES